MNLFDRILGLKSEQQNMVDALVGIIEENEDLKKEIQDLNPFIVVGCGGGGEKFSNLEGIETVGFIDDDVKKEQLYQLVCEGIRIASELDMYVIVDWHMVGAEDPNDKNPLYYLNESMDFFDKITKLYKDRIL